MLFLMEWKSWLDPLSLDGGGDSLVEYVEDVVVRSDLVVASAAARIYQGMPHGICG